MASLPRNTGYFGIPLIIALFASSGLSIAVFATLGKILYESTLGYYLIAKCHGTAKGAAYKVLKAPILYAFLLGIAANRSDVHFPDSPATNLSNFGGAYNKTFAYIGFAVKFWPTRPCRDYWSTWTYLCCISVATRCTR